jgi:hypothetical protein
MEPVHPALNRLRHCPDLEIQAGHRKPSSALYRTNPLSFLFAPAVLQQCNKVEMELEQVHGKTKMLAGARPSA